MLFLYIVSTPICLYIPIYSSCHIPGTNPTEFLRTPQPFSRGQTGGQSPGLLIKSKGTKTRDVLLKQDCDYNICFVGHLHVFTCNGRLTYKRNNNM